jgi:hypothetical protein
MKLVPENPFPGDNISLSKALNKIPSMVVMEGGTFFLHGLAPVGISQSITVRARDGFEYLRMQGNLGLLVPGFAALAMPWALTTGGMGTAAVGMWGPCLRVGSRR